MGLSACCQIFEDIVDPGKKGRERAIQEQKQKEEEEKRNLQKLKKRKRYFLMKEKGKI